MASSRQEIAFGANARGTLPFLAVRACWLASNTITRECRRGANLIVVEGDTRARCSPPLLPRTWRGVGSRASSDGATVRQRCWRCQAAAARGPQARSGASTWTSTAGGGGAILRAQFCVCSAPRARASESAQSNVQQEYRLHGQQQACQLSRWRSRAAPQIVPASGCNALAI